MARLKMASYPYGEGLGDGQLSPLRRAQPGPQVLSKLEVLKNEYQERTLREKEQKMLKLLTQQQERISQRITGYRTLPAPDRQPEPKTWASNWTVGKRTAGVDRAHPLKPVYPRNESKVHRSPSAHIPAVKHTLPYVRSKSGPSRSEQWQELEKSEMSLEAEIRRKEALLREKLRRTEEELRRIQKEKEEAEQEERRAREVQEGKTRLRRPKAEERGSGGRAGKDSPEFVEDSRVARGNAMSIEEYSRVARGNAMSIDVHSRADRGNPMSIEEYNRAERGNPMSIEGHSRAERGNPMSIERHSRAERGNPMSIEGHSRADRGNPVSIEGHSRAKRGNPMSIDVYSRAERGNPMSIEEHSRVARGNPMSIEEHSRVAGGNTMSIEGYNRAGAKSGKGSPLSIDEHHRAGNNRPLYIDQYSGDNVQVEKYSRAGMKAEQGSPFSTDQYKGGGVMAERFNPLYVDQYRRGNAKAGRDSPLSTGRSHQQYGGARSSARSDLEGASLTRVTDSFHHLSLKAPGVQDSRPPSSGSGDEEPLGQQLIPCHLCGRNFMANRLQKHSAVCEKMHSSRRKVFDSSKARAKGTDLEQYLHRKGRPPAQAPQVRTNTWRQKHESFLRTIRQARVVQDVIARGGKLSDLPPPPPEENPDYVSCPHCSRRFAPRAAERHIPKCETIKSKPRPPPSRRRR